MKNDRPPEPYQTSLEPCTCDGPGVCTPCSYLRGHYEPVLWRFDSESDRRRPRDLRPPTKP